MYDARSSTGDSSNIVFGVVTLVVVGLAFALAWFGTGILGGTGGGNGNGKGALAPVAEFSPDSPLSLAFATPDEQRLLQSLSQLDAEAYSELEAQIANVSGREAQIETLGQTVGVVLVNNAEHLAHISAADINNMLDSAGRALNAARASNNELCLGSTYSRLEDMNPRRAERELKRLLERSGFDMESAHAMAVSFQADFLEMTARARANPVRHGKLTPQDEAAFQGLLMSFMTDPAFMGLAMANDPQEAMAKLNVCEIGAKVVREVRQLPDGTKARAWASVFDMPEVRQGLREAKNFSF
jgi:hypothetical protein